VPGKHAGERFLMRAGEGEDILAVVEAGALFLSSLKPVAQDPR